MFVWVQFEWFASQETRLSRMRQMPNQTISQKWFVFPLTYLKYTTEEEKVYELQIWQLKWQNTRRSGGREIHSKVENYLLRVNRESRKASAPGVDKEGHTFTCVLSTCSACPSDAEIIDRTESETKTAKGNKIKI